MWNNSNYGKSNTVENFAYITKNGVAVLPTHGRGFQNTASKAYWYQVYKTMGQGTSFSVDFNGTWIYPIASIHTHPDSGFGADESPDGGDMAAFRSMGIPGFVLGPNNFYGAGMSDLRNNTYEAPYPAQNLLNGSILIIPNIGLFK